MKKIAEVKPRHALAMMVYYDEKQRYNKYRVYREYIHMGEYGITKRKRLINKYGDLASSMYDLYEYAMQHNEE